MHSKAQAGFEFVRSSLSLQATVQFRIVFYIAHLFFKTLIQYFKDTQATQSSVHTEWNVIKILIHSSQN